MDVGRRVEGPVIMIRLVETVVVLIAVAVIAHALYAGISGARQRQSNVITSARWVAAHYSTRDATRVVVRKVGLSAEDVLDEHVVAEILASDVDFDSKFLEAMAQARARAALFESESD